MGCRLLVVGCWLLVVGYRLSVFGHRSIANRKYTNNQQPKTNNHPNSHCVGRVAARFPYLNQKSKKLTSWQV